MVNKRLLLVGCVLTLILAHRAFAIPDPTLEWRTISTEHFDVHFHEGAEWTAEQVARVAEEIYPHITRLYDYEPERVNFVIRDSEDYANGAAYYYDNKVEIWATNLEFGFRGTSEWLRNVVTHEFTHIVSIQAAMKMPRRIPAIYFQMIGFEDEKRPDVLTGYPDNITSYPFVGAVMPPWFAEGVAQYQSPNKQYDCWDSHRDMILRTALLDDEMLSYEEMGYLGHQSIDNEKVYDHGYGLVRYIADAYGADAIEKICEELGKIGRLSMDGALKSVTGKDGEELYEEWRHALKRRYDAQVARIRTDLREGWILSDAGYMTTAPTFSPDGRMVALLSNKGSDFSSTSLYLTDLDGKDLEHIKGGVSSRATFSPDGNKLVYSRHRKANKYGAMLSDIHVYDITAKKETRLTKRLRASEPSFSPDGRRIVFVINGDGTHRIAVMDADGSNVRELFSGEKGTQFYAPQYSPDGARILFGIFESGTRDIATIDADGGDFEYVVRTDNDERDARWLADGTGIVFSADRTGVFNAYTFDLGDRDVQQVTNVIGGAFTPDVNADGLVVYSGFAGKGYHVAVMEPVDEETGEMEFTAFAERALEGDECTPLKAHNEDMRMTGRQLAGPGASSPEGAAGPAGEPLVKRDYKSTYTDFQIFPRVVIYDGSPRLGAFLASNEILDKQSFFLGASYGTNREYDAYLGLELRHLFPVVFLDFILVRELFDDQARIDGVEVRPGQVEDNVLFDLEVRYDLWSADLGLRFEFADPYSITHRNDFAVWYSHSEYRVHIDPQFIEPDTGIRRNADALGWKYYIANDIFARWRFKTVERAVDSDINPRGGREFSLQGMYAMDELFTSGDFLYGFRPDFDDNSFGQYTLDYKEYIALPYLRHTLQLRLYGSVVDHKVDDFFYVYVGGLDGIRGYGYYTIGGLKGVVGSATYRFPILRRINKQFLHLTFKDVYGGVFAETANAWDDDEFKTDGYKTSVGGELRLNLGSFYSYPTTVNFAGAYSLDEVVFFNPVFTSDPVVQGKEWRYYLQIGFTF